MGGVRFVETGDHAVHRAQRPPRTDHEIGPTLASGRRSPDVGDRLERAYDRRSDGDDTMTCSFRRVDALGGLWWNAIDLLVGWFVIFQARDARVEQQRRDLNPAG